MLKLHFSQTFLLLHSHTSSLLHLIWFLHRWQPGPRKKEGSQTPPGESGSTIQGPAAYQLEVLP